MENQLLSLIDQIDQSVADAEVSVMESLIESYDKSIMILQEASDDTDLSAFGIFQEGEKWDKFKEDSKAPVLGNQGESTAKRILMVIPRLIRKLITLIKKTWKQIQYKRLIKRINKLEYSLTNNKWLVSISGKLSKKDIERVLRALHDPDFRQAARDKMSLKNKKESVATESAIITEATHGDNPVKDIGNIFLSSKDKYVSSDGYIEPGMTRESDLNKIDSILQKYGRDNVIEKTYDMLKKHEIRSHFKYHSYIAYLKSYIEALADFRKSDNPTQSDYESLIRKLQQTTYEFKGDSNHIGPNPFYSQKLNDPFKLQTYSNALEEIHSLTTILEQDETYASLVKMCNDTSKHTSPEEGALLREIARTIQFTITSTVAFNKDYVEMSECCTFVQLFIEAITELYKQHGLNV